MKRIFIAFGHHNTKNSFNAAIRDTFIDEAKKCGHIIDLINLFEEKEQLPFYNQNINPPPKIVLDYRKRLEKSSVMMLIGSCHNLRLNAILENCSTLISEIYSKLSSLFIFFHIKFDASRTVVGVLIDKLKSSFKDFSFSMHKLIPSARSPPYVK